MSVFDLEVMRDRHDERCRCSETNTLACDLAKALAKVERLQLALAADLALSEKRANERDEAREALRQAEESFKQIMTINADYPYQKPAAIWMQEIAATAIANARRVLSGGSTPGGAE